MYLFIQTLNLDQLLLPMAVPWPCHHPELLQGTKGIDVGKADQMDSEVNENNGRKWGERSGSDHI